MQRPRPCSVAGPSGTQISHELQVQQLRTIFAPSHSPLTTGHGVLRNETTERETTEHGATEHGATEHEETRDEVPTVPQSCPFTTANPSISPVPLYSPRRIPEIISQRMHVPSPRSGSDHSRRTSSIISSVSALTSSLFRRSSRSTTATSVAPPSTIEEIDKGVFADPTVILNPRDAESWERIRPRLKNTIQNTFIPKPNTDPALSIEFMMAGSSRDIKVFRPTILIRCHDARNRKQLRKIMESQGWLNEYQYQSSVTYDRKKDYSDGQLQQSRCTVRAKVSPRAISLCGIPAEVRCLSSSSSVKFTIGGIIVIENIRHALTVQHMLQRSDYHAVADGQGSIDEADDNLSPFITSYSTETTPSEPIRASFSQEQVPPNQEVSVSSVNALDSHEAEKSETSPRLTDTDGWLVIGEISKKLHSHTTMASNNPFKVADHKLDWSLVDFNLPGTFYRPWMNRVEGLSWTINSVAPVSEIRDGGVWIIAGVSGVLRGRMTGITATICSSAGTYDARIILPERRICALSTTSCYSAQLSLLFLAPGDSGAWVISDDHRLYGHITSGYTASSWVYMIPMIDIFHEIKEVFNTNQVEILAVSRQPPAVLTSGSHPNREIKGMQLALLLLAVSTSMFSVSFDQSIVPTAIPSITDEFESLGDICWYSAAYLLPSGCFSLIFDKMHAFYSTRVVYSVATLLLAVGSAICGSAVSSGMFVAGRTVQGIGAAGIYSASLIVISHTASLSENHIYMRVINIAHTFGTVVGPLIGGILTTKVKWRWCFYINVPFGLITLISLVSVWSQFPMESPRKGSWSLKAKQLVTHNKLLLISGLVSLILALQWGGTKYPWNNGRVLALLAVGGVLLLVFITLHPPMFKHGSLRIRQIYVHRSAYVVVMANFCVGAHLIIFLYFLPLWFQVIKEFSAVDSGIVMLPLLSAMGLSSLVIMAAAPVEPKPFLLAGACLMVIGSGLLTMLQIDTSLAQSIGFQILSGLGSGLGTQVLSIFEDRVMPMGDISVVALMQCSRLLGGAVLVSVGQTIFTNILASRLSIIPDFDRAAVGNNGATTLSGSVSAELKASVLETYNEALRGAFRAGLGIAFLSVVAAVLMLLRSFKASQSEGTGEESRNRNEELEV